jgi:hypothetical protein
LSARDELEIGIASCIANRIGHMGVGQDPRRRVGKAGSGRSLHIAESILAAATTRTTLSLACETLSARADPVCRTSPAAIRQMQCQMRTVNSLILVRQTVRRGAAAGKPA